MPTENEIAMLRAARADGVASRNELANLMAQLGHESGGFDQMEESFRYRGGIDAIPVRAARREGLDVLETARREALDGRPQELARLMYGNRMGNDDAGDGYLYRGRGFIQLTGEENYRNAGQALGLDLVARPELAADRDNAARIALWYWRERVPEAERDDVSAATRFINGGSTGLADRHNRFDAWYAVLTPEFVAELDAGRVLPGARVVPAVGRPAMADNALRRFESGQHVTELQRNLGDLSITDDRGRELAPTGSFDIPTEQAVRRFQQQSGLDVTGRASPETLGAVADALRHRQRLQPEPDRPQPARDVRAGADQSLNDADRALLADIRAGVERLDAQHGRKSDQASERAAWALLPAAKAAGLTRVDHVLTSVRGPFTEDGENLFAVQGRLDDPAHLRTHVKTMEALQQPLAESLARVDMLEGHAVHEPERQALHIGVAVERPGNPSHRIA